MSDLLRDMRTVELLQLLWNAPDREAGVAIVDLPKSLQDEGLFTEWISAKLIEIIRRNHIHTGAGADRKLIIEAGWNVAAFDQPNRKSPWQMVQESIAEQVADEIRCRVRLRKGDGEANAAKMVRLISACNNCGGPLETKDISFDEDGNPEASWCFSCRRALLAAKSRTIAGYKRAEERHQNDVQKWQSEYSEVPPENTPERVVFHRRMAADEIRYRNLPNEILGKPIEKARYAKTIGQLWYFIKNVAIIVLETTRGSQFIQPTGTDPILEEVLSALHLLGVTWADKPPYPILNRQQTIDKLQIIANQLEIDDALVDAGTAAAEERFADATAEQRYRALAAQLIPGFRAPDDRFKMMPLLCEMFGLQPSEFRNLTPQEKLAFAEAAVKRQMTPVPIVGELVTLNQVCPLAGITKRTLERYLQDGKLPPPDVPGGLGRANKWYWNSLRKSLEAVAKKPLPEKFPGSRIID